MEPYVLSAVLAILPLRVRAGDLIVVMPGGVVPIAAVCPVTWRARPLPPNYGLLLLLAEDGALIPLSRDDEAALPCLRLAAAA